MLTKRIIPCLDVTRGRVVKGTNFVDLKDAGDPIELAKRYDREGADELVFLDITATSDKVRVMRDLVEKTAEQLFIPFCIGGGINSVDIIKEMLHAGADKVSINTAAIHDPDLLNRGSKIYGSQCIVLAIDARSIPPTRKNTPPFSPYLEVGIDATSQWEVYTHGGRNPTGIDAVKWATWGQELGAGEILLTSMDRDGTQSGYDLILTETISQSLKIPVIASGGAGNCDHIISALKICEAALLASLLHFRTLTIETIKKSCKSNQIPIRI